MTTFSRAPVIGGMTLIVICFFGSAGLRMANSAPAFAEEFEDFRTLAAFRPASGTAPGGGFASAESLAPGEADALLRAIRDREAQLDAEAQQLADRSQALSVAERKLAEQLAAFEVAQRNLEQTLARADKAAERDIDQMKTVYESMKPTEAAEIFTRMETSFAAGLLSRMRPELAANVMAAMEPDAAYAVTLTIASRNSGVPTE
jgi:flagellar motility protein MotE (MotC chaperone)